MSLAANLANVGAVLISNTQYNIVSAANGSFTTSLLLPAGTTAQRVSSNGSLRFNTTTLKYEAYNTNGWVNMGGPVGGGSDDIFFENGNTVTSNYTITTGKNAISGGPITIANNITVTIPDGSVWTIV